MHAQQRSDQVRNNRHNQGKVKFALGRRVALESIRFLLRVIRPNSGSHRICNNLIVRALMEVMTEPAWAVAPGGFQVSVSLDDYNGRKLWLFGANDWKINRTFNACLFPGDVFLDIGANYGQGNRVWL